jgi:hypothetical protein
MVIVELSELIMTTAIDLNHQKIMRLSICLFLAMTLCVCAQNNSSPVSRTNWINGTSPTSKQRLQSLTSVPPEYRKEALGLIIQEANDIAQKLNLPEELPITESNLVEAYITPPRMVKIGFGNITTSNYVYYVTVGDKFSSLVRTDSNRVRDELKQKHSLPVSQMDTNAAYQLATQWLAAVSIDVNALNRDCNLTIRAWTPEGEGSKNFIPLYRVYWTEKSGGGRGGVAGVELIEPTKILQQLYVIKSEYILRPSLQITNLDLTSPTNSWFRGGMLIRPQ